MSTIRNTGRGTSARWPLTARSVLLSVLLGSDPPRLPVLLLVRTTGLFGIAEGTTRTALSRMAAAGEVQALGGAYELSAPRLLARQARQSASRTGATLPWSGQWCQAVVVAKERRAPSDRAALRGCLEAARLAELREGVWIRPDNLGPIEVGGDRDGDGDGDGDGSEQLRWFTAAPDADPFRLAAQLWDLPTWHTRASRLIDEMSRLTAPLEAGDRSALAPGFVLSAAVLRQFQSDPLLPSDLLPQGWHGSALRTHYDRYDRAYRSVLQDWFAQQR